MFYFNILSLGGTSGGEIIIKLDLQTFKSEFECHWVPSFIRSCTTLKQKAY